MLTDELATAARLSRYTIGGMLGRGAFGITYREFDTLLSRDVAIKEFLPVDWHFESSFVSSRTAPEARN